MVTENGRYGFLQMECGEGKLHRGCTPGSIYKGRISYGFLVSPAPEAGEQLSPAKGLSGLTRGEQCCASGAACTEESFDAVGPDGGSAKPEWRGTIGDADGGMVADDKSRGAGDMGSTGGV